MATKTPTPYDRAAILRRAWATARASRLSWATFQFNAQWGRSKIALGLEQPKLIEAFLAEIKLDLSAHLRAAWAEAKKALRLTDERAAEIEAAEADLMCANAIDATETAMPIIAAASKRLVELRAY